MVNRRQHSTTIQIQWSTEFKPAFVSVSQLMISFVNSYMTRRVQTQPIKHDTVHKHLPYSPEGHDCKPSGHQREDISLKTYSKWFIRFKMSISCYLAAQRLQCKCVFTIPCGSADSESVNRLHRMSLFNHPITYRFSFQPLAAL